MESEFQMHITPKLSTTTSGKVGRREPSPDRGDDFWLGDLIEAARLYAEEGCPLVDFLTDAEAAFDIAVLRAGNPS